MTFRFIPDRYYEHWISYIGLVLLDKNLEPISEPQLLNSRIGNYKVPSQSEDARIFAYKNKVYLIFNDNPEVISPSLAERRDMYMAELTYNGALFTLSKPIKLIHTEKYYSRLWQKNWSPFIWEDTVLLTYTINPHEVIYPNLMDGNCYPCYQTTGKINWHFGELRGSGPSLLDEGEYLSFFHSGIYTATEASFGNGMWHYYMGAYTFSSDPPFEMTKISPFPIIAEGFYTPSEYEKRVIMPGGFVICGPLIHVAYGKDDREIWIATIDKKALKQSMVPVETVRN
ncbi:MAG TPA: hypothetical protein VLF61_03430 [Rhabdochlamydiaceae bacterium]|nr:hypothetical protein [Rhabdochlamydiaceae bacterium]